MASLGDFLRFPPDFASQSQPGAGGTSGGGLLFQTIHAIQDHLGIPEWVAPGAAGARGAAGLPNQAFGDDLFHQIQDMRASTPERFGPALADAFHAFHWDLV